MILSRDDDSPREMTTPLTGQLRQALGLSSDIPLSDVLVLAIRRVKAERRWFREMLEINASLRAAMGVLKSGFKRSGSE